MPYTTSYADDGNSVHKTGSGIVTGLEIFTSAVQEPLDEERARKLRYGLIDFTEVTEMKVTPEDVRRIVEMNRKLAVLTPGAFVAIIAPSELAYAMSRLWHTLSDDLNWTSNVFHARSDALAWLRKELLNKYGSPTAPELFPSLEWENDAKPA